MKKKNKLSIKMIIFCIALSVVLSVLIGGLGYFTYKDNIMSQYNTYVSTLVNVCVNDIDGDDMQECFASTKTSPSYDDSQVLLNSVKENAQVQYIYIVYFDEEDKLYYGMNAYTQEEFTNEYDTISFLGDECGEYDFDSTMIEEFKKTYVSSDNEVQFITNITEAGETQAGHKEYVLTGYKLILNSKGEGVGILSVDISMTDIYASLRDYLFTIIIGTLIVGVIFIVISVAVINRSIIKPISNINNVANSFVEQSYNISNPNDFEVPQVYVVTKDEIGELAQSINHMTSEILTYMKDLASMTANEERMTAQVSIVSQIKMNLLPHVFPAFPQRDDFSICSSINLAKEIKGDFYDYFLTDKDHLCITMGRVSGSGIPTTMFSVIASTHIKNLAKQNFLSSRILSETNNMLSQNNEAGLSVEAFVGIVDLANGELSYSCAGDIKALIKKSGSDFEKLETKQGFELATMENTQYSQQNIHISQGDLLFLYTNGLCNVVDNRGNLFTDENVEETINKVVLNEYSVDLIVKGLNYSIDTFRKGIEQSDDSSMVLFKYM